jgi:hypothetical protein
VPYLDGMPSSGGELTPYTELTTTGRLGLLGAELLYAVAGAVARRYPPPSGGRRWTAEDIWELAHDVITDGRKVPFAEELLANAADDDTLRAYLHGVVRRHLAERGRKSSKKGARVRRLRTLLKNPLFVRVGRDHYTLVGGPGPVSATFHPAQLREAARAVAVERPNWGPETKRTPPEASDASTVEVCVAVLGACPHPVDISELADVLGERFGVPADEADSSYDGPSPPPEPAAHGDATAGAARAEAERV